MDLYLCVGAIQKGGPVPGAEHRLGYPRTISQGDVRGSLNTGCLEKWDISLSLQESMRGPEEAGRLLGGGDPLG